MALGNCRGYTAQKGELVLRLSDWNCDKWAVLGMFMLCPAVVSAYWLRHSLDSLAIYMFPLTLALVSLGSAMRLGGSYIVLVPSQDEVYFVQLTLLNLWQYTPTLIGKASELRAFAVLKSAKCHCLNWFKDCVVFSEHYFVIPTSTESPFGRHSISFFEDCVHFLADHKDELGHLVSSVRVGIMVTEDTAFSRDEIRDITGYLRSDDGESGHSRAHSSHVSLAPMLSADGRSAHSHDGTVLIHDPHFAQRLFTTPNSELVDSPQDWVPPPPGSKSSRDGSAHASHQRSRSYIDDRGSLVTLDDPTSGIDLSKLAVPFPKSLFGGSPSQNEANLGRPTAEHLTLAAKHSGSQGTGTAALKPAASSRKVLTRASPSTPSNLAASRRFLLLMDEEVAMGKRRALAADGSHSGRDYGAMYQASHLPAKSVPMLADLIRDRELLMRDEHSGVSPVPEAEPAEIPEDTTVSSPGASTAVASDSDGSGDDDAKQEQLHKPAASVPSVAVATPAAGSAFGVVPPTLGYSTLGYTMPESALRRAQLRQLKSQMSAMSKGAGVQATSQVGQTSEQMSMNWRDLDFDGYYDTFTFDGVTDVQSAEQKAEETLELEDESDDDDGLPLPSHDTGAAFETVLISSGVDGSTPRSPESETTDHVRTMSTNL